MQYYYLHSGFFLCFFFFFLYNVSDSSDADLHDYLGLANTDIIQYKTRGQKQGQKAAEAQLASMQLVNIETIKPNTRARKQNQKVPDD